MKTTMLKSLDCVDSDLLLHDKPSRLVNAAEFQRLIVSHRRMERVPSGALRMRALRDLDTGEVFLTDERRLFESPR